MRRNWISVVGCVALVAGQTVVQGQDAGSASTPAAPTVSAQAAAEVQPMPDAAESAGLGFRKVAASGGFTDAERTMVRVASGGRIVQTRRVGDGGVAQISDVAAGPYSVFANGSEGIAAYGAFLGEKSHTVSNRVGLVPVRDAALVMKLIKTHLATGATGTAADVTNSVAVATPTEDEASAEDEASTEENSDFEIDADGIVKGKALLPTHAGQDDSPMKNLYVAFVQGGRVVAETQTDATGHFSVKGLNTGIYSLAVAGPEGFAAYSAAVVQPEPQAQARVHRLQFVGHRRRCCARVVSCCARDFVLFHQVLRQAVIEDPEQKCLASCCGGGGGYGGGSGGGGGGGGGLLGLLAGAGIGAAIGAALADDDDDNDALATPAAP